MLMPVDWDGSVSRTTLLLSEANLIDDAGPGRPTMMWRVPGPTDRI